MLDFLIDSDKDIQDAEVVQTIKGERAIEIVVGDGDSDQISIYLTEEVLKKMVLELDD